MKFPVFNKAVRYFSLARDWCRSLPRQRLRYATLGAVAFVAVFGLPGTNGGLISPAQIGSGIRLATEEFVRIRSYEQRLRQYERQLRERASYLDTLLKDATSLDRNPGELNERDLPNKLSKGLGIGGGHDLRSRVIQWRADNRKSRPKNLLEELDSQISRLKTTPMGSPAEGQLSSGFGYRRSPFSHRSDFHSGLDISVERMTPVVATADGMVTLARGYSGYGNAVIIDHGDRLETLYGHLSSITVTEGKKVCRGQQIGFVGSTGNSTGPHLHYEVKIDGIAKNPLRFVELAGMAKLLDKPKS